MKDSNKRLLGKLIGIIVVGILECVIKGAVGAFAFIPLTHYISENTNIYIKELSYFEAFIFLLLAGILIDLFLKPKKDNDKD